MDERPEEAVPFGRSPDRPRFGGVEPDVNELLEHSIGSDDAEGAVAGTDQFDGRLDDPLQDGAEIKLADDGLIGLQQAA
ncbi:hypothetical protein GCM10009808_10880 [Microbacterium sediminicola]|uniref:Uncharacterized protein n=1 Tax=Microbacterium sediminicola TaxID=415210 RepID=A0ABP4U0T6_9MICO